MVSYHLAKFGGHGYCGSGDIFSVLGRQDSTSPQIHHYCLSLKHIAGQAHTHDIAESRHNKIPMK